ncbi:hypothetical protein I6N98_00690 [Spongiibacter nanhainus]|uniref:Sulfotransferase family protein n=1 Tax=Spongiibacter nanhainus TaxID=2794344 RepID=A0A7T4UQF3_9GAMM|nr:sulfotransferase family protein [Spongiibacter nanhainus]QQD18427.1 hypothetical protein I6N98_00690 [Spongiibacter nanhainus]
MKQRKVFCLGFHKTGTTSLGVALDMLGYRVSGAFGVNDPDIAEHVVEQALKRATDFDAFQDNPWPILYRELDAAFPGSKFILLLRDADAWIQSQVKHFGQRETPMRRWIYGDEHGCPAGNEAVYLRCYQTHNQSVLTYFSQRPDDLLVLNLAEGEGWQALCAFLDEPVPAAPFPHANTASKRKKRNLLASLKRALTLRSV